MKIYAKRIVAEIIDSFIYIFPIILLLVYFPFFRKMDIFFYILLLRIVQFKEVVFRGKTIGRIIMKIKIYDSNWEEPSATVLLKRWHLVTTMQNFHSYSVWKTRPSKMKIINTEREKFGTRVIDKKNFLRFSEKAKALPGRWQDNMCRLYDEYLFKLYAKKEDHENI